MSTTTGSAGRDATATDGNLDADHAAAAAKEINVPDRDEDNTSVTVADDSRVMDAEKGNTTDVDIEKGGAATKAETERDPNLVDWDGPDDPASPPNWPDKQKWLNITVLSILTLVT
jgi:hypothetical protein